MVQSIASPITAQPPVLLGLAPKTWRDIALRSQPAQRRALLVVRTGSEMDVVRDARICAECDNADSRRWGHLRLAGASQVADGSSVAGTL
jgi:hypothetical protein